MGFTFVGDDVVVANDVTENVWYANLMTPLPPARPPYDVHDPEPPPPPPNRLDAAELN
jgi:hypothetical protein